MNVRDLRARLAEFPDDETVTFYYEANCCETDEIVSIGFVPNEARDGTSLGPDRVVIDLG